MRITNEEAVKILKNEYLCRINIKDGCYPWSCGNCEYSEEKDDVTQAINHAVRALSKRRASTEQVKILADVLDGLLEKYVCDKIRSAEGWCKDHCKDGQDSPDAECWLEYAMVMTESKTESDKMVDQFRDTTKKTEDDLISRAEAQTKIMESAKRYTIAKEAYCEGHVLWSDNLINVNDAVDALRKCRKAK